MTDRYVYALADWSVEKRTSGWYFSRSRNRHTRADWRGPYRSEFSVTLMLAREFQRELKLRHQEPEKAA